MVHHVGGSGPWVRVLGVAALAALGASCAGPSAGPAPGIEAGAGETDLLGSTGSQPPRAVLAVGTDHELSLELTGAVEVPGPGDPDASGTAVVMLVEERGEVCVEIAVDGLDQPTAAHLHEAVAGSAGDVVLGLPSPPDGQGSVDACVSAAADVLDRLRGDPTGFYVNVHSAAFPDGALRGQLP